LKKFEIERLSTGIPELDRIIGGGIPRGEQIMKWLDKIKKLE